MEKPKIFEQKKENKKYEEPYGLNVKVRSFYFRHAEKASGIVGDSAGISQSAISEKGEKESVQLGTQLPKPAKDGFKIGWSGVDRTLKTGDAMALGYLDDEERKEFKNRNKVELSDVNMPKSFMELYINEWNKNKNKILKEKNINTEEYKKLSAEEQAEIAEKAEEPV
ncbi:unnamed protein product, partial [marine sediment metagenome]